MIYNTRIAPSPTGDLHLGTLRTAYFNWLAARASGGKFILRIDDTDSNRNNLELVKSIFDIFEWLNLDFDYSFSQSSRFDTHREVAELLIISNQAKRLDDGAVQLTYFDNVPDTWKDMVSGDIKTVKDYDKHPIILLKKDGNPTYHFSCVVDDMHNDINLIIRGVDHISNTSKQIAIYNALDAQIPLYSHVGLLFKDKAKMSKRHGAASSLYYKDSGYDADAILNFLLRLGWGPTIDDKTTKMLDRDRALELFLDGGKMRAANVNMDSALLEAYDRKYKAKKGIWRTGEKLLA